MADTTLQDKIKAVILGRNLHSLATITEDGLPWVRYVMGVGYDDFTIQFATSIRSRKVAQIRSNACVHSTCGVTDYKEMQPYVQIEGRAEILTDQETRTAFWMPQLEPFFGNDTNPFYCVVRIVPKRIEYLAIDSSGPEVLDLQR